MGKVRERDNSRGGQAGHRGAHPGKVRPGRRDACREEQNENMDKWKTSSIVEQETLRAVVKETTEQDETQSVQARPFAVRGRPRVGASPVGSPGRAPTTCSNFAIGGVPPSQGQDREASIALPSIGRRPVGAAAGHGAARKGAGRRKYRR